MKSAIVTKVTSRAQVEGVKTLFSLLHSCTRGNNGNNTRLHDTDSPKELLQKLAARRGARRATGRILKRESERASLEVENGMADDSSSIPTASIVVTGQPSMKNASIGEDGFCRYLSGYPTLGVIQRSKASA